MHANYRCPDCHGQLADAGAANAWRCLRCSTTIVETVDETARRVRRFYRQATGSHWGGMQG